MRIAKNNYTQASREWLLIMGNTQGIEFKEVK
jgi:hypothetical protein